MKPSPVVPGAFRPLEAARGISALFEIERGINGETARTPPGRPPRAQRAAGHRLETWMCEQRANASARELRPIGNTLKEPPGNVETGHD